MATTFDLDDVKRRMTGAINAFKHDLGSLRTGRASPSLLDPHPGGRLRRLDADHRRSRRSACRSPVC